MERVAFLVEQTGARISCLLNPESVVLRRAAGLARRGGATGVITGVALSDDPVVATGGGVTEIDLDLLFDVGIARDVSPAAGQGPAAGQDPAEAAAEAALVPEDVRELTRPIWNLTENGEGQDGYGAPPVVRLIWGRAWNIPGVVAAVAERLERFSADGVPQRSWLRLRLRRVLDDAARLPAKMPVTPQFETPLLQDPAAIESAPTIEIPVDETGLPSLRLDQIASDLRGDPAAWRAIAAANGIDDPLHLAEGTVIRLAALPERMS
jgi:Contractile injection system tube protein